MIPLREIVVEERQRQDLGDIKELADSINDPKFGLLQPIVVERKGDNYHLRAGGRRLAAHALLGRTEIEALVRGEMTELEAQLIELEENIRRKNLDWQEEVKAIERIHQLKTKLDPNWRAEQTAAMIGKSRRTVFNAMELAEAVRSIPDVANADKAGPAMNRLKRHKQIKQRMEEVELRRVQVERGTKSLLAWYVHNGDCVPYMRETIADGTMDMIFTDPPWAVNYDSLLIGDQKAFDDSFQVLPTVRDALRESFRVLRDQRFCVMYWPTNATPLPEKLLRELGAPANTNLHELGRWFLTSAGFRVWPRPIIWYKPGKQFGSVRDPSKEITSQYETIFWAFKGDARFFKRPDGDVYMFEPPGADRLHPNEKNLELSEIFIDICTVRGENVFDPFAGSGKHGEAALLMERNCHLVELDREFADRASMLCESVSQKKLSGEIPDLGEDDTDTDDGSGGGSSGDTDRELLSGRPTNNVVLPSPINRAKNAPSIEEFDNHLFDGE